ncbi:class I SAM-dependent methyltransferase [Desulfoluna spongiiphila]|uniref:class I SAM-dependent methyltransferase n=1 Tax=Desulfoluna spongiiphila TaxID=419481 RepID=UPI0012537BF4|nr:class I SAM-dependent methyltransferase [Desulfoluna spongiiphila]VVS94968.1 o-methyltransferase comt-type [Desulfoluna spongiiphila]
MTPLFDTNGKNPMAPVFEALQGPVRMAVLKAAVEMGMADILARVSTPEDIAAALPGETDLANLTHFLDSMAGIGLAVKHEGSYLNSPFAETSLRTESPVYLGDMVLNLSRMQHRNIHKIEVLVQGGPPPVKKEDRLADESKWQASVKHLAPYQRAGIAALAADTIDALPECRSASKIMDIGCGPGLMCMEVLKRHPAMEGVLFDLPAIIGLAEKEVEKEGMASRVSYIKGDYNTTEFGDGYDIIWASHNLYYVKEAPAFFSRLHTALNDDGVFVSLHEGTTGEGTAPEHVVLSRLSLALEGQNYVFKKGEIAEHLRSAGFESVETSPLTLPVGEVELTIARKQRG